ncbi:MAG: aspartate--tRNA(Asn) ligase [Chlamydiae bacterium]|nr:aspartate--tRNA(Asn) ligase [Chlamydiota bacterium]
MKRVLAEDLPNHLDRTVKVRGWLNQFRTLGKINFLILRDRTGFCQIVIDDREVAKKMDHLQVGSILSVEGKVVASSQTDLKVEIINPKISVEVPIEIPPPIEYYKPSLTSDLDIILDHRPIALRNRKIQAIFKIQAELVHAYHLFMHDVVKAVEYFSPNILGASSEGGAEFFSVDYFGYNATLAQSSQLYKQILVGVYERVFALSPFFRAEPSHTPRHLAEGKQFEFEMGFFDDWQEILDVQEDCLKFMVGYLKDQCAKELEILECDLIYLPKNVAIPRITFEEAQEIFFQRTKIDERNEADLSPAAEKELCKYAFEKTGVECIFITDWKVEKRPFYAYPNERDPTITNTFDLLCGGTEVTSGGQRRHTYESMLEGIKMKGMNIDAFADYLSIFKYGMPPHGGFGMGLERLTMTLLKLKNIREASLFPSDPKRIAGNRIKAKILFGGETIRNEILRLLKDHELDFDHQVHEETPTSEDSSRVRKTKMEEGIKALVLRGKQSKKNYLFNIPSHLKLDMKAVSDIVGEKCDFEDPEVIKERFGLITGGVPPFGNLLNMETFFDEGILQEKKSAFNCGLRTESIIMSSKDLITLVEPKIAKFSKD